MFYYLFYILYKFYPLPYKTYVCNGWMHVTYTGLISVNSCVYVSWDTTSLGLLNLTKKSTCLHVLVLHNLVKILRKKRFKNELTWFLIFTMSLTLLALTQLIVKDRIKLYWRIRPTPHTSHGPFHPLDGSKLIFMLMLSHPMSTLLLFVVIIWMRLLMHGLTMPPTGWSQSWALCYFLCSLHWFGTNHFLGQCTQCHLPHLEFGYCPPLVSSPLFQI